jgi:hypothetical protein
LCAWWTFHELYKYITHIAANDNRFERPYRRALVIRQYYGVAEIMQGLCTGLLQQKDFGRAVTFSDNWRGSFGVI